MNDHFDETQLEELAQVAELIRELQILELAFYDQMTKLDELERIEPRCVLEFSNINKYAATHLRYLLINKDESKRFWADVTHSLTRILQSDDRADLLIERIRSRGSKYFENRTASNERIELEN